MLLILDRTEWDAFNILYVSVGWRGRALPLMWKMLGPGASSFEEQREVLGIVAGWMPEEGEVILLTGSLALGSWPSGLWGWAGASACEGTSRSSLCHPTQDGPLFRAY